MPFDCGLSIAVVQSLKPRSRAREPAPSAVAVVAWNEMDAVGAFPLAIRLCAILCHNCQGFLAAAAGRTRERAATASAPAASVAPCPKIPRRDGSDSRFACFTRLSVEKAMTVKKAALSSVRRTLQRRNFPPGGRRRKKTGNEKEADRSAPLGMDEIDRIECVESAQLGNRIPSRQRPQPDLVRFSVAKSPAHRDHGGPPSLPDAAPIIRGGPLRKAAFFFAVSCFSRKGSRGRRLAKVPRRGRKMARSDGKPAKSSAKRVDALTAEAYKRLPRRTVRTRGFC